jgi:hypothetical protein
MCIKRHQDSAEAVVKDRQNTEPILWINQPSQHKAKSISILPTVGLQSPTPERITKLNWASKKQAFNQIPHRAKHYSSAVCSFLGSFLGGCEPSQASSCPCLHVCGTYGGALTWFQELWVLVLRMARYQNQDPTSVGCFIHKVTVTLGVMWDHCQNHPATAATVKVLR